METNTDFRYHVSVRTVNDDRPISTDLFAVNGWDDTSVCAFAETLRDFGWPSGVRPVQVTATKTTTQTDTYSADMSTNPPTFI